MFKKFIGILLVLVLALSLVACGEKGDKPAEDSAPASSDAAPAANYEIGRASCRERV